MLTNTDLNHRFAAQLIAIPHQSLNRAFVGPSDHFEQSIFVKVFASQAKWRAETSMTAQLTDWLLDADEQTLLLVRQDLPFSAIGEMTSELAFAMGRVFDGIKTPVQPSNRQDFSAGAEIGTWFADRQAEITAQLAAMPLVVRHGDVGRRNYVFLHGQLTLIDYERAQLGWVQQDWIKLFYQDFHSDADLIQAFTDGYGKISMMPQLSWYYCVYGTALGILAYVHKVPDPEFLAVGQRMLHDVNDYIQQSED
ncbi:phosphotransferase [Lacticaseibacillus brantae]|uniref:Aminoglycoside phosphotransferase domain-containing protein n=1 Tax=Lacticaseibacillus brantae DSM 23927 TaxID=1423727 RepID=A0A0R2BA83_9LACO|nr:phosphotransferase [Lacticaseibacillus brantae]KRM72636.1 hypothetical protein FC34_GL000345 [Lacticaseibacillus brantae DSM 23927]